MPSTKIDRGPDPIMRVARDILPIFVVSAGNPVDTLSFEGTGFLVAPAVLVTCWHCVRRKLQNGERYAVVIEREQNVYPLESVEQDPSGLDLATAVVPDLSSSLNLSLALDPHALAGADVFSYGYPLGQIMRMPDGSRVINAPGRLLKGYVTRSFAPTLAEFGRTLTLELDMPAPGGLSGAPVIVAGTREIVGVVYGVNVVAQVEELARIDPTTGQREPEVQRIVSFAAAHHVISLRGLRGTATRGRSLMELMAEVSQT